MSQRHTISLYNINGGIYTIPNPYRDFNKLQRQFMAGVARFNQALRHLPFSRHAKGNSIAIL